MSLTLAGLDRSALSLSIQDDAIFLESRKSGPSPVENAVLIRYADPMATHSSGFTLAEMIISAGIGSIVLLGISSLILNMSKVDSAIQFMDRKVEVRTDAFRNFLSDESIRNTLADPSNLHLSCLTNPASPCSTSGGSLKFIDAAGRVLADPSDPSLGFDRNGAPCSSSTGAHGNGFDAINGNILCPFRLEVDWSPICSMPACTTPEIKLIARVKSKALNDSTANNEDLWTLATVRDIPVSSRVIAIDSRLGNFTCALMNDGKVKCWGANNAGQLGVGSLTPSESATALSVLVAPGVELTGVTKLSVGSTHACALHSSGVAYCWGENSAGELGRTIVSPYSAYAQPVLNSTGTNLTGITDLFAGYNSHCAKVAAIGFHCWGDSGESVTPSLFNSQKLGTTPHPMNRAAQTMTAWWRTSPSDLTFAHPVPGLFSALPATWTELSLAHDHVCTRTDDGKADCWGHNPEGQIGVDTSPMFFSAFDPASRVPQVGGAGSLANLTSISTGHSFSCALLNDGRVVCWGGNGSGQTGQGSLGGSPKPPGYVVDGGGTEMTGLTKLSAGEEHVCAIKSTSEIFCWGYNHYGKLGIGVDETVVPSSPFARKVIDTNGLTPTQIALGSAHACALFSNGKVKCWGRNHVGQLGTGTAGTPAHSPQAISGAPGDVSGL